MLRYMTIGLAAMVVSLSVACSSTNVTGIAVPTRSAADAVAPTDGSDVMSAQAPTDGNDVMSAKKGTSDAVAPTDGSDVMRAPVPVKP